MATKPGFCAAFVKVTDKETFMKYPPQVSGTMAPFGGKFVARSFLVGPEASAALSERTTAQDYTITVLCEFPSAEQAIAWNSSDLYAAIKPDRMNGSEGPFCVLEGTGLTVEGGAGAYLTGFIKVHDKEMMSKYIAKFGGTLQAFGGAVLGKLVVPEADPKTSFIAEVGDHTIYILIGFPSVEKALEWEHSPEYQEIISLRLDASTGPLAIVPALVPK